MTERAEPDETFDVVNVKGYGDLVIALACLRRIPPERRGRVRMLLGRYLEPLWAALAPPFEAVALPRREEGPAVLFKARSEPLLAVTRSALDLRRALHRVHDRTNTLLFDEGDIRHRFLNVRARALPERDNLYRRWNAFLTEEGLTDREPTNEARSRQSPVTGRRLHIFPGAREAVRRLSVPLLHELVEHATLAGLEPRVFAVAGEMPHLADTGLPIHEMPRDFAATLDAVSSADRVVSADSMTAHLAEYCGRPVFVLSPTLKYYWLPLSTALGERHSLFAAAFDKALTAFLRGDDQ